MFKKENNMKVLEKINMILEEADKTAYQKFFKKKLKEYDVDNPMDLDEDERKKFFAEVKKEWSAKK
jgi:hypothetical protein